MKSKKRTFNFHLRKKRSSQDNEVKPSEQDTGPAISEPIASRRHARSAKVRCIKSVTKIINDERRLSFKERSRARVANESERQRKLRLEVMRQHASERLAAESSKERQQRLHDQRRRAAQRVEHERRREEQKCRNAVQLSYLPTYKYAVCRDMPNVVLEPIKLYNIVGISTYKQQRQQQSEPTNSTSNNDSGSRERHNTLPDNDDDNVKHEFQIDIKVESDVGEEWELEGRGDGDLHSAVGHRDWNQSDAMSNNEADSNRSRQGDKSIVAEAEVDDIKEEPLDDEFNNVVLERTLLMMCQDD